MVNIVAPWIREHVVKPLTRSKGWRKVRANYIKKNPVCAACGKKKKLQVHHIQDFSTHPEIELDHSNLITLCANRGVNCHLTFGHLGSWRSINPNVESDAKWYLSKVQNRR
jgi:5-methylcytosine-specific restriction endonuclease McrA